MPRLHQPNFIPLVQHGKQNSQVASGSEFADGRSQSKPNPQSGRSSANPNRLEPNPEDAGNITVGVSIFAWDISVLTSA